MSRNRKILRAKLRSLPKEMRIVEAAARLKVQAAADKPKTFAGVAYSGGPLFVDGFDLPVYVDLRGMRLVSAEAPVLRQHDQNRPIGHTTAIVVEGNQVRIEGTVSRTGPHVDEVLEGAKVGYPWQPSISVTLDQPPELVKAGQSATVNGRTVSGPTYIARKSTYRETSFVDLGGDAEAQITLAAKAAAGATPNGDSPMTFEEWLTSCGLDAATLTPEATAALQTVYDSMQASAAQKPTAEAVAAAIKKLGGVQHTNNLETLSASLKKQFEDMQNELLARLETEREMTTLRAQLAQHPDLAKDPAAATWGPVELKAALKVAEIRASRQTGPFIAVRGGAEATPQVLEAALCQTLNLPGVEKQFKPEILEAAHRDFRRLGLQQIIMMAAVQNGYTCRAGERIHAGNLREVMEYACPPRRIRAASTLSLPGILSNVANKELLAGYMEEDQTWREIASIKPVSDFKTHTSYRLLDSMEYEQLGEGGQIKHGTMGEESYTRAAKTYAKMFVLTREAQINDDLGALDDLRTRLGRGAAKKFNNILWALFINNSSFFTSARTNYVEGATTNLGTDGVGLGLGVKTFRKMTSPTADGTKRVGVGGTPKVLLVPPELEQIAVALYNASNSANVKVSDVNTHAGKYRPVVQNRLSDSSFTGYSATAWYLFGDTDKPVVVSFLNGQETPTVEDADADFDTLGIQFRGYHDFGADFAEYLAGIKSKGSA